MIYTDDEIEFLITDIIEQVDNRKKEYDIHNYILDELSMTVSIYKLSSVNHYRMYLKVFPYGSDDEYCDETILFNESKDTIKEIVNFLLKFRDNYKYSKILDTVIKNNEFVKKEKKCMLMNKICKNEEVEMCCVCMEPNLLKTPCKHNLCRVCYNKTEDTYDAEVDDEVKKCPICREHI